MVYWGCMKNKPFIIHPSPASRQKAEVLEERRFKAALLFEKGVRQAEVARRLKVTRPAVHYWYSTWQKSGKDGLRARRPGPLPQLTQEKAEKLERLLLAGAHSAGYDTDLWTLNRIGAVIKKKLHLSYKTTQIWYIMQALGWSNQKPETRARNRNEALIQLWKKQRWPAIKKRG